MGRQPPHKGFDMRLRGCIAAGASALRRCPACIQPVRRGHRQHANVAATFADHSGGLDRLWANGALIGDHHVAIRPRLAQPVGAIDGTLTEFFVDAFAGLFNRVGGEAQIDRPAGLIPQPGAFIRIALAIALHVVKGPFHDHCQLIGKGRFKGGQPVLAHPDERRSDGLVRTAFGRQCHPRGGADQNETRVLITGIVQRIEAAGDKGIIDRADGDKPLAKERMRQARRAQEQHQIHLGNAQFDMLALRCELPFRGRGNAVFDKCIGLFGAGKELAPVHPWAKVGGAGHIR